MKTITLIVLIVFATAILPSCAPPQGAGGSRALPSAGIGDIFDFELNLSAAQKTQVMALLFGIYTSNQTDINNFLKYAEPLVKAITAKKYKKSKIEKAYNAYAPYEKKMVVLLGNFYVEFYEILNADQKKIMDKNINKVLQILQDPFSLLNLFSILPAEDSMR